MAPGVRDRPQDGGWSGIPPAMVFSFSRAGTMGLQVLAGEDPAYGPVKTSNEARPRFDYRQLIRFKIPPAPCRQTA
jgi:hypothetical protein